MREGAARDTESRPLAGAQFTTVFNNGTYLPQSWRPRTGRSWRGSGTHADTSVTQGNLGDIQAYEYVVPVDPDGVNVDWLGGGPAERPARCQVEAGTVLPAFDGAVGHLAVGQRHGLVGALVAERVHGPVAADHAYRAPADVRVQRLVFP